MKNQLVVLMGLQGSGKSSFYRKHLAGTHELVSKDLMKNKKQKALIQARLIRKYLGEGKSVVVDNTNLSTKLRKELIHLGHEFEVPVILYYFPITVQESILRNEGQGRKVIPLAGIYSAAKTLVPPSYDEGFDEIYRVTLVTHEWFEVETFANYPENSLKRHEKVQNF